MPADATLADGGLDIVVPPDLQRADGGQSGNIGDPCDVATGDGCTGEAACLAVSDKIGLCVLEGCSPEDPDTPAKEDSCPPATVCTSVPVTGEDGKSDSKHFCLPACTPDPTSNSCTRINPQLACDPLSVLANGHAEVCLLPACSADKDCGNPSDLKPERRCEPLTGVCFNIGQSAAAVGSPCKLSKDCGPNQFCLSERSSDGSKVQFPGGYCTVVGCKYGGPWSCPAESSKCFGLGSEDALTLCLSAGCEPGKPCRDGYECLDVDSLGVCWIDLTP